MNYRFKKSDWVINKNETNPTALRIDEVDASGSVRCYRCGNSWFMDSELEEADERHFPKPNFEAPIQVSEEGLHSAGFYFRWIQPTVGFGEFSISSRDGKVSADTEGMGPEWCRRAMYAAVDTLIEKAKKDGIWPDRS